jgi:iron complex transport system substrate-binding protein
VIPATRWPRLIAGIGVAVAVAVLATGCGGDQPPDDLDTGQAPITAGTAPPADGDDGSQPDDAGAGETQAAPRRVVALGEEFLLADLLLLGVTPVASTATVPEAGFQGLDAYDTSAIGILPSVEVNLEQLAALQPEVVVTTAFGADQAGADHLASLGELVVVPDGLDGDDQLRFLAEHLGGSAAADAALAELDAARAQLRRAVAEAPEPCVVSVATIYPGPSVAAWVDGRTAIPRAVVDAGCQLVPGAGEGAPDRNGRLFLSPEQLDLLQAPRLVLLQSDTVEGELDAVDALDADPLWQALPAVAGDEVVVLDRLGYPGTPGQLRLVEDLVAVLAP